MEWLLFGLVFTQVLVDASHLNLKSLPISHGVAQSLVTGLDVAEAGYGRHIGVRATAVHLQILIRVVDRWWRHVVDNVGNLERGGLTW